MMVDVYKQLQCYVEHLVETCGGSMEVSFDELNEAISEIERLRALVSAPDPYEQSRVRNNSMYWMK